MSKNDLDFVTRDLASGKLRADQIEKNLEKWMNKMVSHLIAGSMYGPAIIEFLRHLLDNILVNNLNRAMSAHCANWMTEILRDISNASNPTTHLSVIALILSYHPGPCKPIKRRDWLNLLKLSTSKHSVVRNQVATILAVASKKETMSTIFGELIIALDDLSSALVGSEPVPEARSITDLNESFLVLSKEMESISKIQFITSFMKASIAAHGCQDFPIESYLLLWKKSTLMVGVFEALSGLLAALIQQQCRSLLPLSKTISGHLMDLVGHKNESVRKTARNLTRAWVERTGPTNAVTTDHRFGAFIASELKGLEVENTEQIGKLELLARLIGSFGPFIPDETMIELTSILLRLLHSKIDKYQPELKIAIMNLAEEMVKCRHNLAPMALCQLDELVLCHLKSKYMDSLTLATCHNLHNTIQRQMVPFNTPTLLYQREYKEPKVVETVKPAEPEPITDADQLQERIMKKVEDKIESLLTRLEQKKHAEPETSHQPERTHQKEVEKMVVEYEAAEEQQNESENDSREVEKSEDEKESSDSEEESPETEPVLPAKRPRIEKSPEKCFQPDNQKDEKALENIMALFSEEPAES